MPDASITLNPGTGGDTLDAEAVGSLKRERMQLAGALLAEVARVQASSPAGTEYALVVRPIPSGTQVVSDGGGSLTVDGSVNLGTIGGAATETTLGAILTELGQKYEGGAIALDAATLAALESVTAVGPLTDAELRALPVVVSGSVTASGPATDAQLRATPLPISGTVTANLGTIDGAATAARQPALGTAGTPSADVLSVQGIASGTPQPVSDASGSLTVDAPVGTPVFVRLSDGTTAIATLPVSGPLTDAQLRAVAVPVSGTFWQATQPVSGSVTANAGTGPFPISDNAGSLTVDAPVGTPAFVRLSDGASPITALPVTDNAGSLTVDGTVTANPATGALTDRSGTITTGGTAQQAMAANATRKYLLIQNSSDTAMWFNFTTTAVADSPSFYLSPNGGSFVQEGSFVSTEAISIICATTGKKWTAKEA